MWPFKRTKCWHIWAYVSTEYDVPIEGTLYAIKVVYMRKLLCAKCGESARRYRPGCARWVARKDETPAKKES